LAQKHVQQGFIPDQPAKRPDRCRLGKFLLHP
jgi:hypothetical protein